MYGSDEKAEKYTWEHFTNWVIGAEDQRPSYANRINAASDRIDRYAVLSRMIDEDPQNVKSIVQGAIKSYKDSEIGTRDLFLPALGVASNLAMISYWYAMAALRSQSFDLHEESVFWFNLALDTYKNKGSDYQNATEVTLYYNDAISSMKEWMTANPELASTAGKSLYMLLFLSDRAEAQQYANISAQWHIGGFEILSETASQTVETAKKPFVIAGGLVTGNKPPFLSESQWLMARITLYSVAGIYVVSKVAPIIQLALEERRRSRDQS